MPLVGTTVSDFTLTTGTRTLTVTAAAGDRIVVKVSGSSSNAGFSMADDRGLTWSATSVTTSGYAPVWVWTSTAVPVSGVVTLTITRGSGASYWGAVVDLWRSVSGFGVPVTGKGTSGAPALALTTTQAASGLTWLSGDIKSGSVSGRTWRAVNTAAAEQYAGTPGASIYSATWPDAGAAGAKTVGLSAPSGQKWSAIAVEVVPLVSVTSTLATAWAADAGVTTTLTTAWAIDLLSVSASLATAWAIDGSVTTVLETSWDLDSRGPWQQIIVSTDWRAAVSARRRRLAWRVEMIDSTDAYVDDLRVDSGSIRFQGNEIENWRCQLNLSGTRVVPRSYRDYLDPRSGLRARIWWRVSLSGVWAEVPVGVYTLEDPDSDDPNDGSVTTSVTGRDPISRARRNTYASKVLDLSGMESGAAIKTIVRAVAPRTPFQTVVTSTILPALYEVGDRDPFRDVRDIGDAAGVITYADRVGTITTGYPPNPRDITADWQEGEHCNVLGMRTRLETSGIINQVIVRSTNTEVDPPISVTVADDNPGSPTYVGRYGPFTETVESDTITDVDGARALGLATLSRLLPPQETIAVDVPGRPDLDFGALVALRRASLKVGGTYNVSEWSYDMAAADQPPGRSKVTMMTRDLV